MNKTQERLASLTLVVLIGIQACMAPTMNSVKSFAQQELAARSGTIKVAFALSWGLSTDPKLIYADLMKNWSLYGSYKMEFIDVDQPVTYEKLVATEADIVLICNPAGGIQQYTQSEADAIQNFLEVDAKGIFVSYLLNWENGNKSYDDSMLAPLVGVDSGALDSSSVAQNNVYDLYEPKHPIFADVTDPWYSGGVPGSQGLVVQSWSEAILGGAQIVAETKDSLAAVITYCNPQWNGIWVTSMPDFQGNEFDKQFVYNSIVWLASQHVLTAWADVVPTFDGLMSPGEWDDADSADFLLEYSDLSPETSMHDAVIYVKNDETYLYLAVVVGGDDYSAHDFGEWFFENDHDGVIEVGDDGLSVRSDGLSWDLYRTKAFESWWYTDVSDGGTNDIVGAASHTNVTGVGDYTFEYRHPLDTADNAHDFSLKPGDTVGFQFQYREMAKTGGADEWPGFPNYGDIIIAAPPPPTYTLFVRVRDEGNKSIEGALIYLDGVFIGETDVEGNLNVYEVTTGAHKILATKEGYQDEEVEVNVTANMTVTVTLKPTLPPPPKLPDLTVSEINLNDTGPQEGEVVGVKAVVANLGEGNAGGFSVSFRVDGDEFSSHLVKNLLAGESLELEASWTAEGVGSHEISAVIDPENDVVESNEGNNVLTETIEVVAKSYRLQVHVIDAQHTPILGAAVYLDGSLVGTTSKKGELLVKAAEGTHLILVKAKGYQDEEVEVEVTSDQIVVIILKLPPPKLPDITIKAVSFDPSEPRVGEPVQVAVTIENLGMMKAKPFHWSWTPYKGAEPITGYVERGLPGRTSDMTSGDMHTLDLGCLTTVYASFTYKEAGEYVTTVVVDSENEVEEADEENNAVGRRITVVWPPVRFTFIYGGRIVVSNIPILGLPDEDEDGINDLWENAATTELNPYIEFDEEEELWDHPDHTVVNFARVTPYPDKENPVYILFLYSLYFTRDYGRFGVDTHNGDVAMIQLAWRVMNPTTMRLEWVYTSAHTQQTAHKGVWSPWSEMCNEGKICLTTLFRQHVLGELISGLGPCDFVDDETFCSGLEFYRNRTKIQVSEDKHAAYPTCRVCEEVILIGPSPTVGEGTILAVLGAIIEGLKGIVLIVYDMFDFLFGWINFEDEKIGSDQTVLLTYEATPSRPGLVPVHEMDFRGGGAHYILYCEMKNLGNRLVDNKVYRHIRIELTRLHCKEEMDWDQGSWEDEPYLIVTGFSLYPEVDAWAILSVVDDDVDSGEDAEDIFRQPIVVFDGEISEEWLLGFNVILMEQDTSSYEERREYAIDARNKIYEKISGAIISHVGDCGVSAGKLFSRWLFAIGEDCAGGRIEQIQVYNVGEDKDHLMPYFERLLGEDENLAHFGFSSNGFDEPLEGIDHNEDKKFSGGLGSAHAHSPGPILSSLKIVSMLKEKLDEGLEQ